MHFGMQGAQPPVGAWGVPKRVLIEGGEKDFEITLATRFILYTLPISSCYNSKRT
jgi:hypothetical protein